MEEENLARFKKSFIGVVENLGMTYNIQEIFNTEGMKYNIQNLIQMETPMRNTEKLFGQVMKKMKLTALTQK